MKIDEYKLLDEFDDYVGKIFPEDSWKMIFYNHDRKNLLLYIATKNYGMFINVFGHKLLLVLLTFLEDKEEYEECESIVKCINEYNQLMSTNLKTKLS